MDPRSRTMHSNARTFIPSGPNGIYIPGITLSQLSEVPVTTSIVGYAKLIDQTYRKMIFNHATLQKIHDTEVHMNKMLQENRIPANMRNMIKIKKPHTCPEDIWASISADFKKRNEEIAIQAFKQAILAQRGFHTTLEKHYQTEDKQSLSTLRTTIQNDLGAAAEKSYTEVAIYLNNKLSTYYQKESVASLAKSELERVKQNQKQRADEVLTAQPNLANNGDLIKTLKKLGFTKNETGAQPRTTRQGKITKTPKKSHHRTKSSSNNSSEIGNLRKEISSLRKQMKGKRKKI
jgi:hypothetical protein